MQTFSNLRRNSSNKNNIAIFALFVLIVVYESIISIYPFLSPFFGVMFLYTFEIEKSKNNFLKILLFLFIILYEIDKDFVIFSYFLFFYLSKRYVTCWVQNFILSKVLKIVFFVIYAYLGYFLLNFLLSYLFSIFTPILGIEYLFFIIIDITLGLLLFYAK